MIPTRFGSLPDGRVVDLYGLANANGIEVRILDYGGTVQSIRVPDRSGKMADVVLGYDNLSGYLGHSAYFGAIIGRCASRIAGAQFRLDGEDYFLATNEGPHHLHGGRRGFDKMLWQATPDSESGSDALVLDYESRDGEEGYPGTLQVQVAYRLTDANELVIDYRAETDKATPVNPTHHSYFNLAGSGDILDHQLTIHADRFAPVNEELIPTGSLQEVAGTAFDFATPRAICSRIDDPDEQLIRCGGYDHNWILSQPDPTGSPDRFPGPRTVPAAKVVEPRTGRTLAVETSEPALLFYSGNAMADEIDGKGGRPYPPRSGFCLETQHPTDAPNQPSFPSTILRPGQPFRSRTIYRFGIDI